MIQKVEVFIPGQSHWDRSLICTKAFVGEHGELVLITPQHTHIIYAPGQWRSFTKDVQSNS